MSKRKSSWAGLALSHHRPRCRALMLLSEAKQSIMGLNARRRRLVTVGAASETAESGSNLIDRGKINPLNNQNSSGLQVTAPIRIDVSPMARGKWRATLDGKVLCVVTAPLVVAARLLIARGVDPTRIIEMSHGDAEAWSLRGKLSTVAATVLDGETKAQRRAKNGSPVHQSGRGPQ